MTPWRATLLGSSQLLPWSILSSVLPMFFIFKRISKYPTFLQNLLTLNIGHLKKKKRIFDSVVPTEPKCGSLIGLELSWNSLLSFCTWGFCISLHISSSQPMSKVFTHSFPEPFTIFFLWMSPLLSLNFYKCKTRRPQCCAAHPIKCGPAKQNAKHYMRVVIYAVAERTA